MATSIQEAGDEGEEIVVACHRFRDLALVMLEELGPGEVAEHPVAPIRIVPLVALDKVFTTLAPDLHVVAMLPARLRP
jgi:hypothetical protein